MVTHMKTTVELPGPLLREAKQEAKRRGTSLRALVEAGLRAVLREGQRPNRFELRDLRVGGNGLRPEFREGSWERIRDAVYEGRGG